MIPHSVDCINRMSFCHLQTLGKIIDRDPRLTESTNRLPVMRPQDEL